MHEKARREIIPIKPAGPYAQAEAKCTFRTVRADAGETLPPPYLVYFLLVDLLGFDHHGPIEKMGWSVTLDFEGAKYTIAHVKFGFHLFAREGAEWEKRAWRIVGLIHSGVATAQPFFGSSLFSMGRNESILAA